MIVAVVESLVNPTNLVSWSVDMSKARTMVFSLPPSPRFFCSFMRASKRSMSMPMLFCSQRISVRSTGKPKVS